MTRARYAIHSQDETTVTIMDIGSECMSVTNDAEAVVKELHDQGVLKGRRLFYYDSEGQKDELGHDGKGKFTRFIFGGES